MVAALESILGAADCAPPRARLVGSLSNCALRLGFLALDIVDEVVLRSALHWN